MRIFQTNLIDAAAVVQTYTSQADAFPASNLRNPQRGRVWRTGSSVAEEASIFDLGSAMAVTGCAVLSHTLLNTDSLIKVQGHTSNSWSSPAYSETLTWGAGTLFAVFASQSYRWWRFTFTKASAGVTRDVGRFWLGTYATLTDPPDFDGLAARPELLDPVQRAPYGTKYGERRDKQRRWDLEFSAVPDAQRVVIESLADDVGLVTPFLVQLDEAVATTNEVGEPLYVTLRDTPRHEVAGYQSGLYWDCRLNLEESL